MSGLHFFLIAGEASGDKLGAELMAGLKSETEEALVFSGVGGPLMRAQGLDSLFDMDELSVMGIAEVLPKLRGLLKRISQTAQAVLRQPPDALITIDSPDFCLRVGRKVRQANPDLKIIHYVAPSVWAWRPKRAQKMARSVDHVLALLPFEPPYMEKAGMSCDFVGHPAAQQMQASAQEVAAFRDKFGFDRDCPLICVLPGSRRGEVSRLGPVFREVVERLAGADTTRQFFIPSTSRRVEEIRALFETSIVSPTILDPSGMSVEAEEAQKRAAFAACDVALAASGTVSVELAAAGAPMVIAYDANWFTGFMVKRLALVDSANLINLLTETREIPEMLLENCTADKITPEVEKLLSDSAACQRQKDIHARAMQMMGRDDAPNGVRAAKSILKAISA